MQITQNDKNTMFLINEGDAVRDHTVGGPKVASVTNPRYYGSTRALMPLAAGVDTAGGILAWANPFSYALIVTDCVIDVTTASTGTCAVNAGIGTTATTSTTNFIGTSSVNATGQINSGFKGLKMPSGQFFIISTTTGTSTGLVGNAYIDFTPA